MYCKPRITLFIEATRQVLAEAIKDLSKVFHPFVYTATDFDVCARMRENFAWNINKLQVAFDSGWWNGETIEDGARRYVYDYLPAHI